MAVLEILEKLNQAIEVLFKKDYWLLEKNLSEWSITHKMAEHLQKLLSEYNVDCEYNGNIENPSFRKKISVLKSELNRVQKKIRAEYENDDEQIRRAVFPDIIVHKRGNNKNNKLIIEVKKNSSRTSLDYDIFKLEKYTEAESDFKYELGILLVFSTGDKVRNYSWMLFKNGKKFMEDDNVSSIKSE